MYRLGYAAEPTVGHEQYQGRLVIPYLANGHTVNLRFRAAPGEKTNSKYLSLPGTKPRLFNVDVLREGHPTVAIVEGELDAIVMSTVVGVPAVAVAGVGAWLPHMPRCFADVEKIIVVADNDSSNSNGNPGKEFANKIAGQLRNATVVVPPKDMDTTEWVLAEGAEAVRMKCGFGTEGM